MGGTASELKHLGICDKDYVSYNGGFRDEEDRSLPRGYRNECYLASEEYESMHYTKGGRRALSQSCAAMSTQSASHSATGDDRCLYSDQEFLARYALAKKRSQKNVDPFGPSGIENGYHSTSDSSDDVGYISGRPVRRSNSGHVVSRNLIGAPSSGGMQRSKSGHFDQRSVSLNSDMALRTGKRPNQLGPFDSDFRDFTVDQKLREDLRHMSLGPGENDIVRRRTHDKRTRNGIRPISICGTNVQWESKLQELVVSIAEHVGNFGVLNERNGIFGFSNHFLPY